MLFDQIYPNAGITESLNQLGVETGGKIITPWVGDNYAVTDIHGNMLGYLGTAEHEGIQFYDTNMSEIGWSVESAAGTSDLYDADNMQVGFSRENVFGGIDQYDSNGQLESFSQENVFGGTDIFSSDMELSQSTSVLSNPSGSFESLQTDIPDIDMNFEDVGLMDLNGVEDASEVMSFLDFLG